MNRPYRPTPTTLQEILALLQQPVVDEETVAVAIAGTIHLARAQGKSLADVTAEVLHDDRVLDSTQRRWLTSLVAQAWESIP
ncbi:MAG: hypothetical protein SWY16_19660 [Cyanobacteriota bacterium]|nr:hypothetical protein [Cyanobacteriota bacterium]